MDSTKIKESTSCHEISTVFATWSSSHDDTDSSELPDDDDFIASLLVDDSDDLSVLHDTDQDFKLEDNQGLSPTSVRYFDSDLRASKRLKMLPIDLELPPLPNPVKRESWNRPVCTFLNFFGSRLVIADTNEAPRPTKTEAFVPTCKPTLAPTPEILFPVCPCKLKHLIHGGANAVAPPILKLLSTTSICKPVAPLTSPVTTLPRETQKVVDDEGEPEDDEVNVSDDEVDNETE